jgi:hypothetical protein
VVCYVIIENIFLTPFGHNGMYEVSECPINMGRNLASAWAMDSVMVVETDMLVKEG